MRLYKDNIKIKKKLQIPVQRSSAIFPFLINNNVETNILFLGYWFLKRNIKEILLIITLRSKLGRIIYRKKRKVNVIKSFKINIKKIFSENGLKLLNQGSIEIEIISKENLFFPYPAIVVNYLSNISSAFVHSCGRIYNDRIDKKDNNNFLVPETGFDILPDKNLSPFISFVSGPKPLKNKLITLKFSNYLGQKFNKEFIFKQIKPYETKFMEILNREEKKFFCDKKGIVSIKHGFKDFYPRFIAGNSNKQKSIVTLTHSYYDISNQRNKKKYYLVNPNKKEYDDSVLAFPVFNKFKSYSEVAIYPNFPETRLNISLEIYQSNGRCVGTIKSIIQVHNKLAKPVYINVNKIVKLNKIKLKENVMYSAKLIVNCKNFFPSRLKFGINFGSPKKYNIPTNICICAANANDAILKKTKTFKWAPILNKKNSYIILTNSSFIKKGFKKANLNLKFWSEKKNNFLVRKKIINDNGIFWFDLNKDKKVKKFLSSKSGWITIESDNPFVNGFYIEDMNSGVIGGDHIF